MKNNSNVKFNAALNKNIILVVLAGAASLFVLIFSVIKTIQDSQKIEIDPVPNKINSQNIVSISTADNRKIDFEVEIADTESERRYGLMNRDSLGRDQGMLFVFDQPRELSFWMKDTLIPLDMLFFDENKRLIKLYSNTIPNDDMIFYSSITPAMYVLEINGGVAEQNNITTGSILEL